MPAPGRAPAPHRPATPSGWSLRTVNIVLAALVLIVLLFTGNEIWANVRVQDVGPRLETLNLAAALDLDPDRDLPPLEALLDSIDERALFAVASAKPDPVVETVTVPPDQYCSLLGISRIEGTEDAYEAIIMDSKIKKMLYLKVGDAISADGQLWTLKEIQGDRVVFTSGNRESVVR